MISVIPHDVAHGGEAVARRDGKTYFIAGAIPGETVTGDVVTDKGNWARLELHSVDEPSSHRVDPRCPHFNECGGCQWQFVDRMLQAEWKQSILEGQLAHLGGVTDADVRPIITPGPDFGYRNRMDFRVRGGKPALSRARSNELVALDECSLLHPTLFELFSQLGPLDGLRRVTLRVGARTGDVLVVLTGEVPEQAPAWGVAVAVAGRSVKAVIGEPTITEVVAGVPFRIGATSFFQSNTDGADALVSLVTEAASVEVDDVMLDGFAGGGLFATTVGRAARRVVAVESHPGAVKDLRFNLRRAEIESTVVTRDFALAPIHIDEPWNVAVVDPPRTGLGSSGVDALTAADPQRIVYVSCDPASLARDTKLLRASGYHLEWATPVDLFPQTFHVETVARFTLVAGGD
jgi:23S rRNA (uracil1939-C5)-methyltransferase